MWRELQQLSNLQRSRTHGNNQLVQNLRQKAAQLEIQLARIHNLRTAVDRLAAIQTHSSPVVSLAQSQNIYSLVRWIRSYPEDLAHALKWSQDCDNERMARFIVWDLFEDENQQESLIKCIRVTCELLKEDIVKPNSICALLIKHYLQRFGKDYLAHTLK
jgi:hypothetical protein